MQNLISSHTGFQTLKEVWLGDCYPSKFYDHLSPEVRDAFYQITEWTQQDLAKIQKVLEDFNVTVRRPVFSNNIEDYCFNDHLLKPPITPRDENLTLGNNFYHLRNRYKVDPWKHCLDLYRQNDKNTVIEQTDGPLSCLSPPSVVRIGRDIYIDQDTHEHVWDFITPTLLEWGKKYRVHVCKTDGHSDGVFCPVHPGLIVATHYLSIYDRTFPDWEIYHLPVPRLNSGNGKWHMNDHDIVRNQGFSDFIEKYAVDWVGNFSETVYEVNMLVIDEHTVLAIKEDINLFKWLEKFGINVILCDFRCRGFWDGGLHCLTVDIRREGECTDYFPKRPDQGYVDFL
jgi:hypothetical protein